MVGCWQEDQVVVCGGGGGWRRHFRMGKELVGGRRGVAEV